jgi:hypothetical protein
VDVGHQKRCRKDFKDQKESSDVITLVPSIHTGTSVTFIYFGVLEGRLLIELYLKGMNEGKVLKLKLTKYDDLVSVRLYKKEGHKYVGKVTGNKVKDWGKYIF